MIGAHRDARQRLLRPELRHPQQHPGPIVGPAVIAADDVAVVGPALRELGGAVAAAVHQRRRLPLLVQEQHDVLTEQLERLRPVLERIERFGRVPETTKYLLLGGQHASILLAVSLAIVELIQGERGIARPGCKHQISRRSLQKRHRWRDIGPNPGSLPPGWADDGSYTGSVDRLWRSGMLAASSSFGMRFLTSSFPFSTRLM